MKLLTAAMLALAASLALGVQAAQAEGEFELISCYNGWTDYPEARTSLGWRGDSEPLGPEPACPEYGLVIAPRADGSPAGEVGWRFDAPGWALIDGVEFEMSGGTGDVPVEIEIQRCPGGWGCWPVAALPKRPLGAGGALVNFEFEETDQIRIGWRCTAEPCSGFEVRLRDFTFSMNDRREPSAWLEPRPKTQTGMWGNAWLRSDQVTHRIYAEDFGIGLRDAEVLLDDSQIVWEHNRVYDCFLWVPISYGLCPSRKVDIVDHVNLALANDGQHDLRIRARDYLGNTTTSNPLYFRLDDTPPETPQEESTPSANSHGWHSNAQVEVTWENTGETVESATESGVAAAAHRWLLPDGSYTASKIVTGANIESLSAEIPSEGVQAIEIWTYDKVWNVGGRQRVPVRLDRDQPLQPAFEPQPEWIGRAALQSGHAMPWSPPAAQPALESGICEYEHGISTAFGVAPEFVSAVSASAGAVTPQASVPNGVNVIALRAVSCAGIRSPWAFEHLRVDGDPPNVALSAAAAGWHSTLQPFTVNAHDSQSGVASRWYAVDGGPPLDAGGGVTLGAGRHIVKFGAVDNAGNASESQTAAVNVDVAAPTAVFMPGSADRPASVTATVSDTESGVVSAWFELRRSDTGASPAEGAWRQFGRAFTAAAGEREAALSAVLPDDALADGLYELRVVARDAVGHASSGGVTRSGEIPTVLLPVRAPVALHTLSAPVVKRCRPAAKRRACDGIVDVGAARSRVVVSYGARAAVVGELRDAGGSAVGGVPLAILVNRGRGYEPHGETVTDARGIYEFRLPPGPSRAIAVRFAGDELRKPGQAVADLVVSAGLKIDRLRQLKVKERVALVSGRLLGAAHDVDVEQRTVILRRYANGRWATCGSVVTGEGGKFAGVCELSGLRGERVKIRAESTDRKWSFGPGASRAARLRVR